MDDDWHYLRETTTGAPYPGDSTPTYIVLPVTAAKHLSGEIYGFELSADWNADSWFSQKPAYTYMKRIIDFSLNDVLASQDPRHQISMRASFDLPCNIECDLWYRYVDHVSDTVGSYNTCDIRIRWKCRPNLELSLVGQNLLDTHHTEIEPEPLHVVGTDVERSIYGKVVWTFD